MMIEKLYQNPKLIARLLAPPLGPHLEALAQTLHQQQYRASTIRTSLGAIRRFHRWLEEQGLLLEQIDDALVNRYVSARGWKACAGLNQFVALLRDQGVLTEVAPVPPSPAERWLTRYDAYLTEVAGNTPATRTEYLRTARRFYQFCFGEAEANWRTLKAEDLISFMRSEMPHLQANRRRAPAVALRALLRFLVTEGVVRAGLEAAVPLPRQWTLATMPRTLSDEQVAHVLTTCGLYGPNTSRNKAILLLLVRLGLRASEVVRLQLEDIHWRDGMLLIRAGKTHRERVLPLFAEVGQAIADYVRHDRPSSQHRQVFMHGHAPYPAIARTAVSHLAQRILERAGITLPLGGAHVFRHTAASGMVNAGASFTQVADVLGHRSLETTAIYAKLDLNALSKVALPWQGEP
jgi:site-specific recombinase XerD